MKTSRNYGSGGLPSFSDPMRRLLAGRYWPLDESSDESLFNQEWSPAVDVKADKDAYIIHADIPGVEPKDVDITLDQGVLTIQGRREDERKEEKDDYHRIERFSGSFSRQFMLPDAADPDHVKASMKKGVLEIRIPKSEKAVARKIEIKG